MTRAELDAHVAEAVSQLKAGREEDARWAAIYAGIALERLAEDSGSSVDWPSAFASEPLLGWAKQGVEMRRRTRLGFARRPTATHAAHSQGALDFDGRDQ